MQGRADPQREILDVESVAGHLLLAGGVFAFLAGHRRELVPEEMFADLCQVPGLVEAGFSRFDGVPSEVLGCVQSFVLDGRDQSELAV